MTRRPLRTLAPALFLSFALAVPAEAQTLTLRDAALAVLETHPSLTVAEARIEAARHGMSAAESARLPGVAVSGSLTQFDEPMIVAPLHAFDPTRPPVFEETLIQAQAGVAYTLFDAGARGARIDAAGALLEAERAGGASTEMELIEAAATAYVHVLLSRAVLDASQAQVAAVESEVARADDQMRAGTAAEVEVLRARAALMDALAHRDGAESRVGLAERSLARLMGVGPEAVRGRALDDVSVAEGSEASRGAANPALERAQRAIAAAEAKVAEERSARLPRIDVGAALVDFGSLDTDHVVEWQAGVQVSWPIFTGGARSAAVRGAEANLAGARSSLATTELRIAGAIDAAETALEEALLRSKALEASVTEWTEVARIEALALGSGAGTQSDLLRAQAALYGARAGWNRARYDAALARVALARSQGHLDIEWLNRALEAR